MSQLLCLYIPVVFCGVIIYFMQIISWNIRGLGSSIKKRFLSKLTKKKRPDLLFVQETKMESVEKIVVQRMWGNPNLEFASSSAVGASGGLLIIWNKDNFKMENVIVQRHFIALQGVFFGFPCMVVNVYAPNDVISRRIPWEDLLAIKTSSQVPWCVGGDFNEIKDVGERVGCLRMDRGMRDFLEFFNNMELVDLPMLGRKFTWTNFQNHAIHSRLDRFLVAHLWLEKFNAVQWGLPRPISDHCPVMLIDDSRDWGPRPFRFMDMWLSHPGCLKLAQETWNNHQVMGWAGFSITQKLRAVKEKLKVWNKEVFGNVNLALQNTELTLHQLDVLAEERQLDSKEKALRCMTKSEFWRLSRLSESLWRQKSRVNWLKLGDRNTRFFQTIANNRFERNMVGSVKVNGRVLEEPKEIKEAVVVRFSNNFMEERSIRPKLGGVFIRKLNEGAANQLQTRFAVGEIEAALKHCSNLKAPGPDGFNFSFVKKGWGFLKGLVLQFFDDFHANGKLSKGINSTFVALIPKVYCPTSFREYRPISMVGWVYKLLAKVLANRLKGHLSSLIGESQAAFIEGKQILDGVLIANEVIHSWKHSTQGGLLLKIDFERAYDCVNWGFLLDMMAKVGFGGKWCGWIKECCSTVSMSVLINGSASKEFQTQKGLRQGDPLSPFLFNLVLEALNLMLERARDLDIIRGARIGANGVTVTHLQFADDTIIFCNNDVEEMANIKRILRCFQLMSGLKINFSKSSLCGVKVLNQDVEVLAQVMGCKIESLPIKYLGLPLGANPRRIKTWEPVIDSFERALSIWRRRCISSGGQTR